MSDPVEAPIVSHHGHPLMHHRVKGPPVTKDSHGLGLNGRLAVRVTGLVGTMWMAYAFVAVAVISLPAALATGDKIIIVGWIAQTFLQLVLLPIIIVGQNVQAAAADRRAEATYLDAEAILRAIESLKASR